LERIGPRAQDRASFHVVAGWLARAEGNAAEQEQQFDIAVRKEPKNDLYQFNLAAIQIRSSDPAKSSGARANLERLSQVPEFRSGALRALLNDAVERKDFQDADRFAQQLQMSPQVTFGDYLLCLNFYRKLDAKKFDAVLEKVKPAAARNSTDLGLLMDWMNENGLAAEVIKWMDKLPNDTTDHPPPAIANHGATKIIYASAIRHTPLTSLANRAQTPSSTHSGARPCTPPAIILTKKPNSLVWPANGICRSKAKNFGRVYHKMRQVAAKRSTHFTNYTAATTT
jgi:hypothetical protein